MTSHRPFSTDAADRLHEQILVLRCQTGDEGAFAELVERYTPRLRYYLRKLLPAAGSADDLLQDVWLAVFRGLPRLGDAVAFPAWLFRITRDRAARELRQGRRTHHPLEEADLVTEAEPDEGFSPDDARRIHAGLDELAPEHREVLVLRFLEDMSYEDIARVTDCPLGTVRSRLHYAKRALRRVLERKDGDD
jgi:RNA polymerase sigma-70 factor (ECF subfamily)